MPPRAIFTHDLPLVPVTKEMYMMIKALVTLRGEKRGGRFYQTDLMREIIKTYLDHLSPEEREQVRDWIEQNAAIFDDEPAKQLVEA